MSGFNTDSDDTPLMSQGGPALAGEGEEEEPDVLPLKSRSPAGLLGRLLPALRPAPPSLVVKQAEVLGSQACALFYDAGGPDESGGNSGTTSGAFGLLTRYPKASASRVPTGRPQDRYLGKDYFVVNAFRNAEKDQPAFVPAALPDPTASDTKPKPNATTPGSLPPSPLIGVDPETGGAILVASGQLEGADGPALATVQHLEVVDLPDSLQRRVRLEPGVMQVDAMVKASVATGKPGSNEPLLPIRGAAELVGIEWASKGQTGFPESVVLARRDGLVRVVEVGTALLRREREKWLADDT